MPEDKFAKQDWNYLIYRCKGMEEELPSDMPTPLEESMRLRVYVDSDHAGDQVTRRPRTGFIVYLNNAPIYWFSKQQTLCETSTHETEFIAIKQACKYVQGL